VRVSGVIAPPDGSSVIRAQTTGVVGDGALGRSLARMLLQDGSAALIKPDVLTRVGWPRCGGDEGIRGCNRERCERVYSGQAEFSMTSTKLTRW
jgi:hypothetical protein